MASKIHISDEALELLKTSGFIREFFKQLPLHKTYNDAYEAVEKKYRKYFGQRKYKDYNSFQTVKKRLIK